MPIVTLITNPAMYLDATMVETLSEAMGGGAPVWLNPTCAAEYVVPKVPRNARAIWESLQGEGVDMVIQPDGDRRRKLLLADMDSTMIQEECIDELAEEAGVGEAVRDVTLRAMNGEVSFEDALRDRVARLKGLPLSVIDDVLARRIHPMPGGATLVATMKAHGAHASLVSGGFTAFSRAIAERLGFDDHRANTLEASDGKLTGTVADPVLGREAKVLRLKALVKELAIKPLDVMAIGDGANDLGMLKAAGTGVAVHAKPAVQAEARHRINHGDLTALLYIQGYRVDAFIRA